MQRKMTKALLASALMVGSAGFSHAQDTEMEQMRAEMAQMRAEMAQMRAQQEGDWMNSARRAEIEGMIADVFSDAQNRASLLQEGALAGINEKGKIFLQSGDGKFTANFDGQIQFRYIWNSLDTDNTSGSRSESLSGFQVRRAKFGVKGKVGDGFGYGLKFAAERGIGSSGTDSGGDTDAGPSNGFGAGDVVAEDAYITYDSGEGWKILAGAAKLPFARQELISSSRQVGVDRTLVTEFFTLNRSDQVQLQYTASDTLNLAVALSDGANASFSDFSSDSSNDFAVTARADWMAIGEDWGASRNEFGGVDADALFVGAAIHIQDGEGTGGGSATSLANDSVTWTIDALYKTGAWGITAAIFANHVNNQTASDFDQLGLYIQGSYDLGNDWDVFGRWEYIDDDGRSAATTGELEAVTLGVNHHFNSKVKFTADVVWIYSGDNPTGDGFVNGGELSSGLGLSSTSFTAADDHDDQVALRLQLQLLF